MTEAMTAAGLWVLRQAATLPDTIFTRQIAPAPSAWDRVISIAGGLLTIIVLVIVFAAVPVAWMIYKRINALLDRLAGEVAPVLQRAAAVADDVNHVTTAIRTDVERVSATVTSANDRLQQAVEITERRLNEFNALLAVVQEEAERMFVATASTVHGVRTGASALGEGAGTKFAQRTERSSSRTASDEERASHEEETTHGDEHDSTRATDDVPRPRVRSRSGRRGDEWGWA